MTALAVTAKVTIGDHAILGGIDLDVAPVAFVSLLGLRVSGKTTSRRAINGSQDLTSDSINAYGNEIAEPAHCTQFPAVATWRSRPVE